MLAAVGRYAVGPVPARVRAARPTWWPRRWPAARETLGEVADAVPEGTALVDTAGFSEGGVKLGLGSSAAAAVAAAGAVLEYAGVSAGRQQGAAVQRGRRRPPRRPGRRRLGRRHRRRGVRRLRALRAHERRRAHHQPGAAAAAPAPGAVLDAGRGAHRRLHRRGAQPSASAHPGATTGTCRRCAPGPTTSPRPSPPATRAGSSARPTLTGRRWRRWGRTPGWPSSPPPCARRRRWPAAWADGQTFGRRRRRRRAGVFRRKSRGGRVPRPGARTRFWC